MNHPTREDWMSYLHDETNGPEGRALQQHLGECAECRAQVSAWQAMRRRLDTWKLAPPQPRRPFPFAWPRLATAAAAAVVLLAGGLAVGRMTAPARGELASLRADLETMQAGMEGRIESAARAESQAQLREFATALNTRLRALQADHATDYALLRRELETVAVLTQVGFNQTEDQLVMLAKANPSDSKQ